MIVLCDLDGIVTDFVHSACKLHNRTPADLSHYEIGKSFPVEPWFDDTWIALSFVGLSALPGAARGLETLTRYASVYIVSAPMMGQPDSAAYKIHWCARWLPFIPAKNIILTHAKDRVAGDWFIDDSPQKLSSWKAANPRGKTATITYPYNADVPVDVRGGGWDDTEWAWRNIVDGILGRY